jgi:putative hydroxymethylpyrimidine transporter CytX
VATLTERLAHTLEREAPEWGIEPVPDRLRRLSGLDLAVLWGDLSIGLLVLASGALLVPSLGLPRALLAIAVGSVLGCLPLALIGLAGAREGVPGMVLFRPVLGRRGSVIPSIANLVQLVGWAAFEFWAMARVADAVGGHLLGVHAPLLWLAVVAVACTALALAGPIFAVRRWLERFGVWIVAAAAVWITVRVVAAGDLASVWSRPGTGGLPFWLAVDLVIANPVSWLPLIADYTRFARGTRGSFACPFVAYAFGNAWFYALGALLVLLAGSGTGPLDLGTAIAATAGGGVVLLVLLAGETDQAMANVYSAAVSVQNVRPSWPQRRLIVIVGVLGFAISVLITADAAATFESFLFLIGSVFVPLSAVYLAFRLLHARDATPPRTVDGVRGRSVVPWVAGFVVYQWMVPLGPSWWVGAAERAFDWLRLPFPLLAHGQLGASIPGFVAAFAVALLVLPRETDR